MTPVIIEREKIEKWIHYSGLLESFIDLYKKGEAFIEDFDGKLLKFNKDR